MADAGFVAAAAGSFRYKNCCLDHSGRLGYFFLNTPVAAD